MVTSRVQRVAGRPLLSEALQEALSLVRRMIARERTEAGRLYAVLWNSWDEREWRTEMYTERLKSLLLLILMRVLDQAPGFRLQLVQELPKKFRLEFSALHSRERSKGNSGGRWHHTWDSKDGGRKKGHSRNGASQKQSLGCEWPACIHMMAVTQSDCGPGCAGKRLAISLRGKEQKGWRLLGVLLGVCSLKCNHGFQSEHSGNRHLWSTYYMPHTGPGT